MKKILVVDDDPDILTLVKMTLNFNGFTTQVLSQWEDIDNTIKQFGPHLILLDISLGTADGRDICRRLKSKQDTQHIPVILFSANIEMKNAMKDCNAQAFISKPYEVKHFLETIRLHLNTTA